MCVLSVAFSSREGGGEGVTLYRYGDASKVAADLQDDTTEVATLGVVHLISVARA